MSDIEPLNSDSWREISSDPNDPRVIAARRAVLARAWVTDPRQRQDIILDLCRDRKVLDLGCVDHDRSGIARVGWLHARIAEVAEDCLGVDFEQRGVADMHAAGYDAVLCDITGDVTELVEKGPFDVVVAGEIVEHLGNIQALFTNASRVLHPRGVLIVTSPNPHAPWRARAAQLRRLEDSVDHVCYVFPSGVAELASRSGLKLERVTTVGVPWSGRSFLASCKVLVVATARWLGNVRSGEEFPLGADYVTPVMRATIRLRGGKGQTGETSVYTLVKEPS